MRPGRKEEIASRFWNYPALYMVVKLWLYSGAFRAMVLMVISVGITIALALPKIWRSTPEGFTPEIRISFLDVLQARALERSGREALEQGKVGEALISYQLAIENTPANQDLLRRSLRIVAKHAVTEESRSYTVARLFWLLRLSQTNAADLEMASDILNSSGRFGLAIHFLKDSPKPLPPTVHLQWLKSLVLAGEFGEFSRALSAGPPGLLDAGDGKLLALTQEALRDPAATTYPVEITQAAQDDSRERSVFAHRLLMQIALARGDSSAYEKSLQRLGEHQRALAADHARFWMLLAQRGQRSRAQELAVSSSLRPASEAEVEILSKARLELGLDAQTLELLAQYIPTFPASVSLWLLKGFILQKQGDWSGMLQTAIAIRDTKELGGSLDGFAHYLEGRALLAQDRPESGASSFAKAVASPFVASAVGSMAQGMIDARHPAMALQLLRSAPTNSIPAPSLHRLPLQIAESQKDESMLLTSARFLHQSSENDLAEMSNLAAALLINRKDPAQALALTLRITQLRPDLPAFRINHAQALTQNYRPAEAIRLLQSMGTNRFSESERTAYHFAVADARLALGETNAARLHAALLRQESLFPSQLDRIKEILPLNARPVSSRP